MLLNINGSDDPSYRYKMHKVVGKIEGRGNGIKTVIVNASEISKELKRPTAQFVKFFGCELCSQSKYEDKTDRAVVNGAHDNATLQNLVFKYIESFVLCNGCRNPETVTNVTKKKGGTITLSCKACGKITEVNPTHPLCKFILKDAEKTKDSDKSKSAKEKPSTGTLAAVKNASEMADKDGEAKGKKDSSKKSKTKKKDENALSLNSAIGLIQEHLKGDKKSDTKATVKSVKKAQEKSGLKKGERIALFYFAVALPQPSADAASSSSGMSIPAIKEAINTYKAVFEDIITGKKARKRQNRLLRAIEEAYAMEEDEAKRSACIKMTPILFMSLIKAEIVDDSAVLEWFRDSYSSKSYKRASVSEDLHKQVIAATKEMAELLEEDEDDEDDDDEEDDEEEEDEDDDDDDDEEEDEKPKQASASASKPAQSKKEEDEDEDEDEDATEDSDA